MDTAPHFYQGNWLSRKSPFQARAGPLPCAPRTFTVMINTQITTVYCKCLLPSPFTDSGAGKQWEPMAQYTSAPVSVNRFVCTGLHFTCMFIMPADTPRQQFEPLWRWQHTPPMSINKNVSDLIFIVSPSKLKFGYICGCFPKVLAEKGRFA